MKTNVKSELSEKLGSLTAERPFLDIETDVSKSWSKISPSWPLKNFIAANPLAGFQHLPFKEALDEAHAYFQTKELPEGMLHVNRETIKWLQAYFDAGQSTIAMPMRELGLLDCTRALLPYDEKVGIEDPKKKKWLEELPKEPNAIIAEALFYLGVSPKDREEFLTLLLTTLPGWAAYIQYRCNWADHEDAQNPHTVTQSEYLALRLILTCLIWPNAKGLISFHREVRSKANKKSLYQHIVANEQKYQRELVDSLAPPIAASIKERPDSQLVFCIDVRSEPFRRALESQGQYETLGFAGFFGLPVHIEDDVTGESHASCPVLLKPSHKVTEKSNRGDHSCRKGHKKVKGLKGLYQSLKYTFTAPFSLVETLGLASGLWMGLKSFTPRGSKIVERVFNKAVHAPYSLNPDLQSIPLETRVALATGALKTMGLTDNFAPLIVFCGHGSTTQNNAYETALHCGACGGYKGAPNARILATILNDADVRDALRKESELSVPDDTLFLAGEHNTTTDEVELFDQDAPKAFASKIAALKSDLESAREQNCLWRCGEMGLEVSPNEAIGAAATRSQDWAQVRPEWGLAKNAAFIIGPRSATENVNLKGRSFLHSYNWEQDRDRSALKAILGGPMVVTHWINSQYLFSTLDNVAYGSGSKTTKNIVGKIGIMQGNASDLLHGLPLQSVYKKDEEAYHQIMRLTVVLYAPTDHVDPLIAADENLQKLFGNQWLHFVCYDPKTREKFILQSDLTWKRVD